MMKEKLKSHEDQQSMVMSASDIDNESSLMVSSHYDMTQ